MFDAYKSIQQQVGNSSVLLLLPLSFSPSHLILCGVFSSLRWAGCSTALARLLARNLTSVRRALVEIVSCLAVLFQRTYYTALLVITLTLVTSLIDLYTRIHFRNSFCQKRNCILTIFTILFDFLRQHYRLLSG